VPEDRPAVETAQLLHRLSLGDAAAAEQLLPLVYDELHRLASRLMQKERSDHTLQATALLHEAFLRLCGSDGDFDDRHHFLRVASKAMRNVLVDHARARKAQKRGGGQQQVDLDLAGVFTLDHSDGILAVDETLSRLSAMDPQLAQIVELRFFGGLENQAIAAAIGSSLRSVERGWRTARAWLSRELAIHTDGEATR
jgi:RNA polymerase sigma factor (TIGR02999 family)